MTGTIPGWSAVVLLVACATPAAVAQTAAGLPGDLAAAASQAGARSGGGQAGEGLSVQEIERQFDQFELVQARRALGLDDDSFRVVAERLERVQLIRRRHQNQRRTLLRELREALESGAVDTDEAGVIATLTGLSGLPVRQAQELRRAQQALDNVLTVRQRAQFRLFQERFERQKLDLLTRARQGRGRGGPPLPGR